MLAYDVLQLENDERYFPLQPRGLYHQSAILPDHLKPDTIPLHRGHGQDNQSKVLEEKIQALRNYEEKPRIDQ